MWIFSYFYLFLYRYQKCKAEKLGVQYDLEQKLMILHSYNIVKRIVKTDDHENAAGLLNRVATNISQFQASKINILTSTVIEVRNNLFIILSILLNFFKKLVYQSKYKTYGLQMEC